MASSGAVDEEENQHDRRYYINQIIKKLHHCSSSCSNLLPTAIQERSMEEALRYLVSVLSSNECHLVHASISSCCRTSTATWNRQRCLKEIMNQLSLMERQRLYNPPADHEIPYYLLIKKYIRSILAFFFDRAVDSNGAVFNKSSLGRTFGCVSFLESLHFAEEVAGISQHLADLSELLLRKDANNDFTLKPIMNIEDDNKIALPIHGSKECNYKFYCHKFKLASIDLRSNSENAIVPLAQDEKILYLQVLDSLASVPLIGVQDEMSTSHSDMLNQLFLERIDLEMRDSIRYCEKIMGWILKDLYLTECWQSIKEIYDEVSYETFHQDGYLAEVKKPLVDQCGVSKEELPNYISRLDRSLRIAEIMALNVVCCYEESSLSDKLDSWEALHALTIFYKCGSSVESIIPQHSIVENPNKHVPMKLHYKAISQNELSIKNKDENVQLLRDIIEDLKRIGNSTSELDKEELALLHKIWGIVASSSHFFFSALAYEQKHYLIHRSELLNDEILRLSRSSRRSENIDELELENMWLVLSDEVTGLRDILKVYKKGLAEKMICLESMSHDQY